MNIITISLTIILAIGILFFIYQYFFTPFARLQRVFNKFHLRGIIYLDSNSDIWEYNTEPLDIGGREMLVPRHRNGKIYLRYVGMGSEKKAMRELIRHLLEENKIDKETAKIIVFISIAAAIISIIALSMTCVRFEPFVLTDSSTSFVLTIIVGLLAVAITVVIGVQIVYMVNTEKRLEIIIKEGRKEIEQGNSELQHDLRQFSNAAYYHSAQISYYYANLWGRAFMAICDALRCALEIKNRDKYINSHIDFFLEEALDLIESNEIEIIKGINDEGLCPQVIRLRDFYPELKNMPDARAEKVHKFIHKMRLSKIIKGWEEKNEE